MCACPPGQAESDGACAPCPTGKLESERACVDSCPTGKLASDNICVSQCPPDRVEADGVCVACSAEQKVSDGVCVSECPQGRLTDGRVCRTACLTGKVPLDGVCVSPQEKCEGRGWTAYEVLGVPTCEIRYRDAADAAGVPATVCHLSLCNIHFGPDLEFPQRPADGSSPVYVYNCDPDGTTGLVPATFADGSTECARQEAHRRLQLRLRLFLEGPLR